MHLHTRPAAQCTWQPHPPRQLQLSSIQHYRHTRPYRAAPHNKLHNKVHGTDTALQHSWNSRSSSIQCCSSSTLQFVKGGSCDTFYPSTTDVQQHLRGDNPKVLLGSPAAATARLPDALMATFPARFTTLTSARKACRKQTVLVDGVLGSCATDVTQGQLLQILDASLPHASSRQQAASTGNSSRIAAKQQQQPWQQLDVLYIDEHLAVVVKPFGLHIYGRGTGHLKHWLSQAIPASTAADALPAACPVHRLDAMTGGLVLCARTLTAAQRLTQAFENRQVQKQYIALLAGRYPPSSSSSSNTAVTTPSAAAAAAQAAGGDTPLQPNMSNNSSISKGDSSDVTIIDLPIAGKPASTALRVLSHTPSLKFDCVTTVQLHPSTGRKHQLRLHMSALGHPILGDPLYNQFAGNGIKLAGKGMCLWAQRLEFDHPLTGQRVCVETAEPARFEKVRVQEAQRHAKFAAL